LAGIGLILLVGFLPGGLAQLPERRREEKSGKLLAHP